jgi:hypothetical protein
MPIAESLQRSIIEFLDSARNAAPGTYFRECGTLLESMNSTFFYGGQAWEITLPICKPCARVATGVIQ